MKELNLTNDTIIIIPSILKNKWLKKLEQQVMEPRKIFTKEELKGKYYFDYDKQTLYYLMQKYHYQYDVAKMYLSQIYKIGKEDFGSEKIKKILQIKEELIKENKLIYTPFFKEYLKGKTLLFLDCTPLSFSDKKMIKELEDICHIEYYHEEKEQYSHECIYELDTIEEEVIFVADQICNLVEKNVPLNKIKLCGISGEYSSIIKRVFDWFHLPITFDDNSLYATKIGQDFLEHLVADPTTSLEYIKENYNLNNIEISKIYNELITIVNSYVWAENLIDVKDFIIEDLKNKTISPIHYVEEITMVDSLAQIKSDEYVFLLGFNQGEIPKTLKDEDYFNDDLKEKLGLETTSKLNEQSYQKWLLEIKTTKNLMITTKKNSSLGTHYLSSLNDDLNLEVRKEKIGYQHSHLYNQIKLTEKIDTLIKYNEIEEDLTLLYSNYSPVPYGTYQSHYQPIDNQKIKEYLNHKLVLSYSAMNTYYQCGFRYYLSNVLKLNQFEETFYTILGNLFHYILSICFDREINLEEEYNKFLSKCTYTFNSREKYFLKYLKKDLEFIIDVIKEQSEYSSLKKQYSEKKVVVPKNRKDMEVTFKGFVDKMLVNEEEDLVAIIDYKTGNPDLNLNHVVYGLDLQLPVYLYLARKQFPNARIVGFYLQKILNNEISKDYKHSYDFLKKEKLKLQGYSNKEESIIEKIDSSYQESHVIKGMRVTSKGLASKKVLTDEEIEKLINITEEKIEEAIDNILASNFDINPKRVGTENLGCKYCEFKDICFHTEKDMINLKEYKNMEFLGGDINDTKETSECNLD